MKDSQSLVKGVCAGGLLASVLLCSCLAEDARSQAVAVLDQAIGSVSLQVEMAGAAELEQLSYSVTRDLTELRSGAIVVAGAEAAPPSELIEGLTVGPVDVRLIGWTRNGIACGGSSQTAISGGRRSALAIRLLCPPPNGNGNGGAGNGSAGNGSAGNGSAGSAGNGNGNAGSAGSATCGGSQAPMPDAGNDAGAPHDGDGGTVADAGPVADGGSSEDGGVMTDSGTTPDSGTLPDSGPDPEPSLCDAPADDCDTCSCDSCSSQLDACEHAVGMAQAGPAVGTSRAALCLAFASCARTSGCSGLLCYCGPGVDLSSCLSGGAFGACRDEMIDAAETTTPTSIISRQGDTTYALGLATDLNTCRSAECAAECD